MAAFQITEDQREKMEWAGRRGCEGYQMGAPPLHQHWVCLLCGGHQPKYNEQYPNCFRLKENSLSPPEATYRDYIIVGHEPDCAWNSPA